MFCKNAILKFSNESFRIKVTGLGLGLRSKPIALPYKKTLSQVLPCGF